MRTINMRSSAHKIKGQGVASAYSEQVSLVKEGLKDRYTVYENKYIKTDIVHYHTIDLDYYLETFINDYKTVNVGYVHFLPETVDESIKLPAFCKKVFYEYIIKFYKRMDYIVTVNPYFINELAKYGINKKKVTYIPNYVSKEKFHKYDNQKRLDLRKQYNVDSNDFVILGVGQIQTRKGVKDFVEVAKMLPDVKFIWAGGFSFGRITDGYKELKEVVENPPENVKFLGIIDRNEMNNIYNLADVMFLPSHNELFPMTILESMNCNIPILLRDIDIYKEILFDYYAKGTSNDEFCVIIRELNRNAEFYKKWADKANDGSVFYSKENVLKLWEEFYDKVLESTKTKRVFKINTNKMKKVDTKKRKTGIDKTVKALKIRMKKNEKKMV